MGKRRYIKGTPEERFTARVVKSDDPGGCWEYEGFRFKGYGKFGISPSETVLAHHFAYKLWVGQIPDGHVLHHKCENPACVRPDHLEPKPPGVHRRDHAREKGVVTNQYGEWSVAQSAEEKRIRDRDWMREHRRRKREHGQET